MLLRLAKILFTPQTYLLTPPYNKFFGKKVCKRMLSMRIQASLMVSYDKRKSTD